MYIVPQICAQNGHIPVFKAQWIAGGEAKVFDAEFHEVDLPVNQDITPENLQA